MSLLDLLFPPKCPFCGKILNSALPLCDSCNKKLPFINGKACAKCGKPLSEFSHYLCADCKSGKKYFVRSFVPLTYSSIARQAAVRLKYYSHPYYAKAFAYLLADKILADMGDSDYFDFITYVPQSKAVARQRGYNQSKLIAKHLAGYLKLKVKDTLFRSNAGQRQATLNRAERLKNVKKSYGARNIPLQGNALLVDDIYTTGATSNYCASLLKRMGCNNVYLAIALINGGEINESEDN